MQSSVLSCHVPVYLWDGRSYFTGRCVPQGCSWALTYPVHCLLSFLPTPFISVLVVGELESVPQSSCAGASLHCGAVLEAGFGSWVPPGRN